MILTLTNISNFDFFNRLETFAKEIKNELELGNYSEGKVKCFTDKKVKSINKFISKSINKNSDCIINLLVDRYGDIFDRFNSSYTYNVSLEVEREVERLDRFRKSLEHTIAYLSVVESLNDPNVIIEIADINEKKVFLLDKLNTLFSE